MRSNGQRKSYDYLPHFSLILSQFIPCFGKRQANQSRGTEQGFHKFLRRFMAILFNSGTENDRLVKNSRLNRLIRGRPFRVERYK